jgi:thiosulfate/3-mercaptopyruvate sulfurtransferase
MIAASALLLSLGWIVSPEELAARPAGTVTVLDARGRGAFREGHLPGAVRIDWSDFRDRWWRSGRLPDDLDGLATELAADYGVDQQRPVVVYGNAHTGSGEEGRIVWMLAYLGHPDVSLLDGGFAAWVATDGAVTTTASPPLRPARFAAQPSSHWRAETTDVERWRVKTGGHLLDVRTAAEWRGERAFGEARGGHLPGALHLDWRELLGHDGRLDRERALARLATLGLTPETPLITYCTGGVRSAHTWVLLRALGWRDVRNYDGSWWEWSADPERPLVTAE